MDVSKFTKKQTYKRKKICRQLHCRRRRQLVYKAFYCHNALIYYLLFWVNSHDMKENLIDEYFIIWRECEGVWCLLLDIRYLFGTGKLFIIVYKITTAYRADNAHYCIQHSRSLHVQYSRYRLPYLHRC